MKYLLTLFLVLSFSASALTVTLTDPDEEITGDSKLCVYSGHNTTKYYEVSKSENCPFAKSFEVNE